MRFGYCTGFAAGMAGPVDYGTLELIETAGYDYVEFPLMQLSSLEEEAFRELTRRLSCMRVACDACCNMFPASVRLLGEEASPAAVMRYLQTAFPRMAALGVRKVVLGSSAARRLPDGMDKAEGVKRLAHLLAETVTPFLESYDIQLVMEPIGSYEANFIHTLPDGMEVVRAVNHPRVQLLADSVHLLYENETPEHIVEFAPYIRHIHLCEAGRALPAGAVSQGLGAILDAIRRIGYNGTVSFEPMPHSLAQMRAALQTVRLALGRE